VNVVEIKRGVLLGKKAGWIIGSQGFPRNENHWGPLPRMGRGPGGGNPSTDIEESGGRNIPRFPFLGISNTPRKKKNKQKKNAQPDFMLQMPRARKKKNQKDRSVGEGKTQRKLPPLRVVGGEF